MRWVVSLESVPSPARAPILKSLASALGLAVAESSECPQSPLEALLNRIAGLARLPADADALWLSSCTLDTPSDPIWKALYADLSAELARRLLPPDAVHNTRHLMVLMDADCDEAFETLFGSEPGGGPADRRLCREDLQRLGDRVASYEPGPGVQDSPLACCSVRLACPRFAADNPAALEAVAAQAVAECRRAMHRDPGNKPS